MNQKFNIKWVESTDVDKISWDKVVSGSSALNLYCYTWYLDAVSDNWGALVLGDYEFILPIPYTVKKNQSILYQPFFSQQLNILGKQLPSIEVINYFISSIPQKFKLAQFNFPNYLIQNITDYEIEEVVGQYLDLNQDYEAVSSEYSTNAKRQIKKAIKNELTVTETGGLEVFMPLFKETVGVKLGFLEDNYSRLNRLMNVGLLLKKGRLLTVQKGDEVLAMGYFFIQNKRITYLKGASTIQGRDTGAMYYLMDAVIKEYAATNRIFDFGGSKVPSVAEFYKKLGAKDQTYLSFSKNNLPWVLKTAKGVRDKFK